MSARTQAVRTRPVIGLTGGIGVGKSTVAALLAERGALIVDVDGVCRDVIEPGGGAHAALIERFGPTMVNAEGRLDRAALGAKVFGDPQALTDLTAISHPAANLIMAERADAHPDQLVVLDIAVLAEYPKLGRWPNGGYSKVLLVETALEVRLTRLVESRGMKREDALSRIAAQVDDEARRKLADSIIRNDGDTDALRAQIDEAWPVIDSWR